MTMTAVENFKRHWEFVNSMTVAFAEGTPDEHWDFSPHPRFAPFSKLGQWSIYAALAGYETPLIWKLNWGL